MFYLIFWTYDSLFRPLRWRSRPSRRISTPAGCSVRCRSGTRSLCRRWSPVAARRLWRSWLRSWGASRADCRLLGCCLRRAWSFQSVEWSTKCLLQTMKEIEHFILSIVCLEDFSQNTQLFFFCTIQEYNIAV